jgi:hypothetical protein
MAIKSAFPEKQGADTLLLVEGNIVSGVIGEPLAQRLPKKLKAW